MALGEILKGKLRLPLVIVGGILLFVIVFGLGILLGWLWGTFSGGERGTAFSFRTIFTEPNDYRLLRTDMHLSSAEVAQKLRNEHRDELARAMRQVLDQNFRTAGKRSFTPTGDALLISRETKQMLESAAEAQIRSLDQELRQREETLVIAITIYIIPEGG